MEAIRRILHDEIEKRIRRQKVMLVFGARRVGKTVLLKQTAETNRRELQRQNLTRQRRKHGHR